MFDLQFFNRIINLQKVRPRISNVNLKSKSTELRTFYQIIYRSYLHKQNSSLGLHLGFATK